MSVQRPRRPLSEHLQEMPLKRGATNSLCVASTPGRATQPVGYDAKELVLKRQRASHSREGPCHEEGATTALKSTSDNLLGSP